MYKAGSTAIHRSFDTIEVAPQEDSYSKVTINVSEDISYTAGTDSGKELVIENPFGTAQMARDILNTLKGFQYQPYTMTCGYVDLAAELGDGISMDDVYSGIYDQTISFNRLCRSDLSAPQEDKTQTDTPYVTKTEREYKRQIDKIESEFRIQADEISAKVSSTGGKLSSFGWSLTENGFILSSGSKTVFEATESGIEVTGKITATSGYIGNGSSGFEITDRAIRNGVLSMSDTSHFGIYVGTDGICLGKGAFKVDSNGNLTAASGTFRGKISAGNIQYGGSYGSFNGAGLTSGSVLGGYSGAIGGGTITTANTNGGINTSLGYADFSNGVFNGWQRATLIWASAFLIGPKGTQYVPKTIIYVDAAGNEHRVNVLAEADYN